MLGVYFRWIDNRKTLLSQERGGGMERREIEVDKAGHWASNVNGFTHNYDSRKGPYFRPVQKRSCYAALLFVTSLPK